MKDFEWHIAQGGEESQTPESSLVALAQMVFGEQFEVTDEVIEAILKRFLQRHNQLLPPGSAQVGEHRKIALHPLIVSGIEEVAEDALNDGDYLQALERANDLNFYGELALAADGDNMAFMNVLTVAGFHRDFANHVRERFGASDPYLVAHGQETFNAMDAAWKGRDFHRALVIGRGIVHRVVLNGTLGAEAREAFDPLALIGISA
ncbi:hypothetical protein HY024_00590 [Candidatus Curtissbacteria bacterium]|nr:hypothetical protein [Candidatus Curtissbacteria bacterium]